MNSIQMIICILTSAHNLVSKEQEDILHHIGNVAKTDTVVAPNFTFNSSWTSLYYINK